MKKYKLIAIWMSVLILCMPIYMAHALSIDNVRLSDLKEDETTVNWETDEPATSAVLFGDNFNQQERDNDPSTQHSVTIPTPQGQSVTLKAESCVGNNCVQSEEITFTAGPDVIDPDLNVELPTFSSNGRVDVVGTTEPFSSVEVIVNNRVQRFLTGTQNPDGRFSFLGVPLSQAENVVVVKAVDPAGNDVEKSFDIGLDNRPPRIDVQNFPEVTNDPNLNIQGQVSEPATLEFFVNLRKDNIPPERVEGLQVSQIQANRVGLQWDDVEADDLLEYGVFRDDDLIGITSLTSFTDSTVGSTDTANYRVSAVDESCNEGPRSNSVEVTTPSGGQGAQPVEPLRFSCLKPVATLDTDGSFVQTLPLRLGPNEVTIQARDRANNLFTFRDTTLFDNQPPQFANTNLEGLGVTFLPQANVKGKLSERATVFVFINDQTEPTTFARTDDVGNFELEFGLITDLPVTEADAPQGIVPGQGFRNNIRLEAVDEAGLRTVLPAQPIIFALCGFGSDFQVTIDEPFPSSMPARLILEGFGEVGFNFNLTYQDLIPFEFRGDPVVRVRELARGEEEAVTDVLVDSLKFQKDPKGGRGFARIKVVPPRRDPNAVLIDEEKALTDKTRGKCLEPGVACIRVPLELETRFVKTFERSERETSVTGQLGDFAEEGIQKTCINLELVIDERIPPEALPDNFLTKTVKIFGELIDGIDTILQPLEQIFKVVFYTCLAGFVVIFALEIKEKFQCEFKSGVSLIGGGEDFDPAVARTNTCELVYAEDDGKQRDCSECRRAHKQTNDFQYLIQFVCDRVYCPSAPTLQTYVKEQKLQGTEPVSGASFLGIGLSAVPGGGVFPAPTVGQLQEGSSCALPDVKANTYSDVKRIYDDYLQHEGDSSDDSPFDPAAIQEGDAINCNNLHPAVGQCCGYEYMDDHSSTCLFMDEIKESKCLQAQIDGVADEDCEGPLKFFNALAGLCEQQVEASGQPVDTNLRLRDTENLANPEGNEYFLFVVPGGGEQGRRVLGGYAKNRLFKEANPVDEASLFDLNKQIQFRQTADYSSFFTQEKAKINCDQFLGEIKRRESTIQVVTGAGNAQADARDACQRVKGFFSDSRDQIVDPTSGFLRSAQCGCIPGINSYLQQYRNVLGAVRNCFNSVLLTGDFDPGVCQATLSVYICDLIYEVISCFVKRFEPGLKRDAEDQLFGSLGNIVSTVTAAGSATQQRIAGRYGRTSLFKAMFVEKKLVNSICLFAFTGTFDIDINGFLEAGVPPIPLESTALVNPATRRFINFDETSDPSGLTTWNYNLGVLIAAGADLNFKLELVCSSDFSCDASEGFPNGKCDCAGPGTGEKTFIVSVPPRRISRAGLSAPGIVGGTGLKAGELLNEELFINVQTPPGNHFRYDKARLSWSFRDNEGRVKTETFERSINQVGGNAPGFCAFDILSNKFRCTLDIGNQRFAKFSTDPNVVFPRGRGEEAEAYKLGDTIEFDVPIVQRPDEACSFRCANTKFLLFEVRNQQGKILKRGQRLIGTNNPFITDPLISRQAQIGNPEVISQDLTLNIDGENTKKVRLRESISEADFAGIEQVRDQRLPDAPGSVTLRRIVDQVVGVPPPHDIIVEIFKDGRVVRHDFDRKPRPRGEDTLADRFSVHKTNNEGVEVPITPEGEVIVTGTLRMKVEGGKEGIGRRFDQFLNENKQLDGVENIDRISVLIFQAGGTGASECDRFRNVPAQFRAIFEIHDAEQVGGAFQVSPTVTVDVDGNAQREELVFNVFCNEQVVLRADQQALTDVCKENQETLFGACHCYETTDEAKAAIEQGATRNCGPANPVNEGNAFCVDGTCLKGDDPKVCAPGERVEGDSCICKGNELCAGECVVKANAENECGLTGKLLVEIQSATSAEDAEKIFEENKDKLTSFEVEKVQEVIELKKVTPEELGITP